MLLVVLRVDGLGRGGCGLSIGHKSPTIHCLLELSFGWYMAKGQPSPSGADGVPSMYKQQYKLPQCQACCTSLLMLR